MQSSVIQPDMAGKVAIVTGAASGIGAALTNRLLGSGIEVHTLDVADVKAPVAQALECDIGDAGSIDRALDALPEAIDVLFNCAGVANGGRFDAAQVMAINWLGLRYLSEALLSRIRPQGSITHVASTAGRRWTDHVAELRELLAAEGFAEGAAWVAAHPDLVGDGYAFSKEAVQYYTMARALEIRPKFDLRMNSICPGVTNTELAADFRRGVGDDVIDRAVEVAGRFAEPAEMAPALMFLADHASASYINGVNLNVDRGTGAAHLTGAW